MLLQLENLVFAYLPGAEILRGINLAISPGERMALIGANGSGKTTLLLHFNGLLRPLAGRILWRQEDVAAPTFNRAAWRRQVGFVFQQPLHQLFNESVTAELTFGLRQLRLSPEETRRRLRAALALVGLDDPSYYRRSPLTLSHGEQRRLALATVLAMEPSLLVLDEATAGLDAAGTAAILAILKARAESGMAVVMATHDLEVAANWATRVVVLAAGRVIRDGPPQRVFHEARLLADLALEAPAAYRLIHYLDEHNRPDLAQDVAKALNLERAVPTNSPEQGDGPGGFSGTAGEANDKPPPVERTVDRRPLSYLWAYQGYYQDAASWPYRLDPRGKLAGLLLYSLAVFLAVRPPALVAVVAAGVMIWSAARLPARLLLTGLGPLALLALMIFGFQAWATPGLPLVRLGPMTFSRAGAWLGLIAAARLLVIGGAAIFVMVTSRPLELMEAAAGLLQPLRRLRLPVQDMATVLGLSLRFIPLLAEEVEKISRAQKARGLDWEKGPLWQRVANRSTILLPLLVGLFRRAEEVAVAMEGRGYSPGAARTALYTWRWRWPDWLMFLGVVSLLAFSVLGRWWLS